MDVFFDTEFTTLSVNGYPMLISIGCVAVDGRECYFEVNDTWNKGICSDFVIDNVLPLLQGGECSVTEEQLSILLRDWIEGLTDKEVVFKSDAPAFDWSWVFDLFQFYGTWPKNLKRKCSGVYFDTHRQAFRFAGAQETYWKNNDRKHHALEDARCLQFAHKHATRKNK
jgi:hypothetical protein